MSGFSLLGAAKNFLGGQLLDALIPSAYADQPAPVEDRNPPGTATTQAAAPRPVNTNPMMPIGQTPPSGAQQQGINQDMAGFAKSQQSTIDSLTSMIGQRSEALKKEIDPEKAKNADPEVMQLGAPATAGSEASVAIASRGAKDPGFFDQAGGFFKNMFGDEEKMARMALAFNTLRYEPDPILAQALNERIETHQNNRIKTQTYQMLMQSGDPRDAKLAEMLRMGADPKEVLKARGDFGRYVTGTGKELMAKYGISVADPDKTYNYDTMTGKTTATGSGQTINLGGNEFAKELYKDLQENRQSFREQGLMARDRLMSYNRISNILQNAETGKFAETKKAVADVLSTIGLGGMINMDDYNNAIELQAAANELVAEELRKNKGPQTDFDARFAQSYVPGLGNPKDANKAMVSFAQSRAAGELMLAQISNKIRSTDPDVEQKMAELDDLALGFQNVMFAPNGQPLYFSEFAQANQGSDPKDIMTAWVNKLNEQMAAQ